VSSRFSIKVAIRETRRPGSTISSRPRRGAGIDVDSLLKEVASADAVSRSSRAKKKRAMTKAEIADLIEASAALQEHGYKLEHIALTA
jgi:hypothetical protein